jgi:pimeloyl-ACP methyl ester carboxylesterase
MTVVLVHGVPETTAVWDALEPLLGQPAVRLALPGFGNHRLDGFGSTMDDYLEWLRQELAGVEGPVDLVGHDWGVLTTRLVTTEAGHVRSWVTDVVNTLDPAFEWHDFGKLWATPGEGEKFWDDLRADKEGAAAVLASLGVAEEQALKFAEALDEEMTDSILRLYRSATDIPFDWGRGKRPEEPGLVLVGGADPFMSAARAEKIAGEMGVPVVTLDGGGHWWPLDSAEGAAGALKDFWAGLED